MRSGSETAFREIVSSYVDLVYSTALRLVGGDTHRAEDISQNVFMDLARQARSLSSGVLLGGWLHRHTCFVAAHTLRGERRRQIREREAVEVNAPANQPEAGLAQLAPILDETINELGAVDRTAILLRFFEQRDFRSVGAALGSSEDAARMRVSRALEKLARLLKRRGVNTGAGTLAVLLAAESVHAAPVALASTISTAAVLAGTLTTAATGGTAAVATQFLTMTALQKSLVTVALVAVAGFGFYETREISALRRRIRSSAEEQAALTAQLEQLTRERDESLRKTQTLRDEADQLTRNSGELVRLRAELTTLRRQRDEALRRGPIENAGGNKEATVVDPAWVERMLGGPLKQQGAVAGALRNKLITRNGGEINVSELAFRDGLLQRQLNQKLESSPPQFADFQTAFIQATLGMADDARVEQIHEIIRSTYEQAVANGLDIPSKPTIDPEEWVLRRYQLDRAATAQVKQLLSNEESHLFDRAFLGVMGIDLGGIGVDKSNYPPGVLGE